MNEENDIVKDLTLMLLYLTSWNENELGRDVKRSWKGYPIDVLKELRDDDGFIYGSYRAKSVHLTDGAVEKAEKLLKQYGLEQN